MYITTTGKHEPLSLSMVYEKYRLFKCDSDIIWCSIRTCMQVTACTWHVSHDVAGVFSPVIFHGVIYPLHTMHRLSFGFYRELELEFLV